MSKLDAVAAEAGDLPALPDVALRVLELASTEEASARDFERIIVRDQALAARVLRISNSAYYGLRGNVSTVSHAVVVLGAKALRSIVLAGCAESLCRSRRGSFKDRILWEHTVATAVGTRFIAKELGYVPIDEALVAGLLHDIGKAVMDANRPEEYRSVIERVYNRGVTFLDAEREVFGFDHAQVGVLVARKWTLAKPLQDAVECHHDPARATADTALAAIVSLANAIAVKLEIGPEKRPDLELSVLPAAAILNLDGDRVEDLAGRMLERIEAERQTFGA